jgi:crotonobetaine/carnitine-CoA ligase
MTGKTTGGGIRKMARSQLRQADLNAFSGRDVAMLLDGHAQSRGAHPFLIWEPFDYPSQTWSYAEFAQDTVRLAAGLAARGLMAGDRLLIHLENCPEFLLAWFACARLGVIAVTTNTRLAPNELKYCAGNAGITAAITQPKLVDVVQQACSDIKWIAVTNTDAGRTPEQNQLPERAARFDTLFEDNFSIRSKADPWAPLSIMYTSGATSYPKGVLWTHANALWGGRVGAAYQLIRPSDTHLLFLPLYHTNAMTCQMLSAFAAGATIVLHARFSASRFWEVALRHKCTLTSVVPFCVNALQDQPVPDHSFRLWGGGLNGHYDAQFGIRTLGWWGMTETMIPGIVGSPFYDDAPMTLGRPSPFHEIVILDEAGNGVGPGETGDLKINGIPGLSLFHSYYGNPDETEASFDEQGFFATGDRCTFHPDGTITFADRAKDMLKVGGENVGASEVERVIASVPGVSEAAVVARPHPMLDEVPVAFIIAQPGFDSSILASIEASCASLLADFKRPREYRFVDELPRGTLNKVAKGQLRTQLAEEERAARAADIEGSVA